MVSVRQNAFCFCLIFYTNKKLEFNSSGKKEKGLKKEYFYYTFHILAENTESSFNVIRNYFFNGFVFRSKSCSFSFELR